MLHEVIQTEDHKLDAAKTQMKALISNIKNSKYLKKREIKAFNKQ